MVPDRIFPRMLERSTIVGGCIESTYSLGSHGYSQIGWNEAGDRVVTVTHRAMWELLRGPIPAGLTLDHECRNRRCHNLSHLRLLTNAENAALNGQSQRTHCPLGHVYDEANTYLDKHGHRRCRACQRLRRKF